MSNFYFNDENCITIECSCGEDYSGSVCDGTITNICPICGEETMITCFEDEKTESVI